MPKQKANKTESAESLRTTASKAQAALERLDAQYQELDSTEQALTKVLDGLKEEERHLAKALEASQSQPSQSKPKTSAPDALARLESALMASSSDESGDESEKHESAPL